MGVYEASQLENIAQTLKDLGRKRAILIHGANGMDEATLSGKISFMKLAAKEH